MRTIQFFRASRLTIFLMVFRPCLFVYDKLRKEDFFVKNGFFLALIPFFLASCSGGAISSASSDSTENSPSSMTSSASSSIDYGTLNVDYCYLLKGYTKKACLHFSKPERAEEVKYYIADPTVCDIEDDVVSGLKSGSTKVEVESEHFRASFTVYVANDTRFGSKVLARGNAYANKNYPSETRALFIGDSFFDTDEFWTNFYTAYYGIYNCFSMGISATTASNWYFYAQRLIIPQNPENVVIHIGTNDINDDHLDGKEAFETIKALLMEIHDALPSCKIELFGIEPSVAFAQNLEKEKATNSLSKEYASENPEWLTYLDSPSAFSKADGSANGAMLRADGLHPLLKSYDVYKDLLTGVLNLAKLPQKDAEKHFQMLNGGDSSLLNVGDDGLSFALLGSKGGKCAANRAFYCLYDSMAYSGDFYMAGVARLSNAQSSGFSEIYASSGLSDWATSTSFQHIYQNKGSFSSPSYSSYWWGENNVIKKTFENGVGASFDFALVFQNGMLSFMSDGQSITQNCLTPVFSFSAECADLSVSLSKLTTDSAEVSVLASSLRNAVSLG